MRISWALFRCVFTLGPGNTIVMDPGGVAKQVMLVPVVIPALSCSSVQTNARPIGLRSDSGGVFRPFSAVRQWQQLQLR